MRNRSYSLIPVRAGGQLAGFVIYAEFHGCRWILRSFSPERRLEALKVLENLSEDAL